MKTLSPAMCNTVLGSTVVIKHTQLVLFGVNNLLKSCEKVSVKIRRLEKRLP